MSPPNRPQPPRRPTPPSPNAGRTTPTTAAASASTSASATSPGAGPSAAGPAGAGQAGAGQANAVPGAPVEPVVTDAAPPRMRIVRPYAITGGRTRSGDADLPIETLVVTTPKGDKNMLGLALERRSIAQLCHEPISVAEVAARIGVPLGVARVLVGDMASDGFVEVHRPQSAGRPDLRLLERVLGGIRAI